MDRTIARRFDPYRYIWLRSMPRFRTGPYVELTGDMSAILETIAAERHLLSKEAAARSGTPIHPLRLVYELRQFLGTDITLCLDMGSFHLWIARHLYSFRPRQVLITNGQQTLGVALPWGIAASIVRPAEKILSISGDGGFLYSAMELETAVRLKANNVHMVKGRRVTITVGRPLLCLTPRCRRRSDRTNMRPICILLTYIKFGSGGCDYHLQFFK